jgi:hypothetical protein
MSRAPKPESPEPFLIAQTESKRPSGRAVLFAGVAGACVLGVSLGLWARPRLHEGPMAQPSLDRPPAAVAHRLEIVVSDHLRAARGAAPIEVLPPGAATAPAVAAPRFEPAPPPAPLRPPEGLMKTRDEEAPLASPPHASPLKAVLPGIAAAFAGAKLALARFEHPAPGTDPGLTEADHQVDLAKAQQREMEIARADAERGEAHRAALAKAAYDEAEAAKAKAEKAKAAAEEAEAARIKAQKARAAEAAAREAEARQVEIARAEAAKAEAAKAAAAKAQARQVEIAKAEAARAAAAKAQARQIEIAKLEAAKAEAAKAEAAKAAAAKADARRIAQAKVELARAEAAKAEARADARREALAKAATAKAEAARASAHKLELARAAKAEKAEELKLAKAEARAKAAQAEEARLEKLAQAAEAKKRVQLARLAHALAPPVEPPDVQPAKLDKKHRHEVQMQQVAARKRHEPSPRRGARARPEPVPAPPDSGLMKVSSPRCASSDPGEAMTCADPNLTAADRQLTRAYQGARSAGVPEGQLQAGQQRWLAARAAAAREAPWALHDVYMARIAELNGQAKEAQGGY